MAKDELKKEAEENSFRYTLDKPWACEVERKQIMAHFEKGYLAGAEPREKRIAELKEQIQSQVEATIELDKENVNLKIDMESSCKAWEKLSNEYKSYKKENAELKAKNKWYSEQVCNKECAEVWGNLTKAKEIIKGILPCCRNYPQENAEKIKQAEQFLKEIEK